MIEPYRRKPSPVKCSSVLAGHQNPMKATKVSSWELKILLVLINERMYGLQLKKAIEERYGESMSEGTLYPTLHRMYKKGFLTSEWGNPVEEFNGARRKFYTVSSEGSAVLSTFQMANYPPAQPDIAGIPAI
jgi:PadR family transcriptional regulator, regulatory protein PadR